MSQLKDVKPQPIGIEDDRQFGELLRRARRIDTVQWAKNIGAELRTFRSQRAVLPFLLRKPALVQLWLATARRAQIALGVMLFLLVFVAPPTLNSVSDYLYPPVKFEKKILGFIPHKGIVANQLRDTRYTQFLIGVWVIGLGLVVILLVNHIPVAITIGERRAVFLSEEAQRLDVHSPQESARLRRSAQRLLIDGHEEDESPDPIASPPNRRSDKTLMISAAPPTKTRYVGANQRYRLDKMIGSGGMGVVQAGYDTVLKRPVALKQLFGHLVQNIETTERFRQEALALASLSHPNIVTVHDLLEDGGHFWIVMELLIGGSFADKIDGQSAMDVGDCVAIIGDVAAGLAFAHSHGVVHRDVKPMNILFAADATPKLTDFGSAKLTESIVHTREGMTLGSPAYMSPEQITGAPVGYCSDIYSLGVSLYQALTGTVPFEGDTSSILAQHVNQPPRAPSELNPAIPDLLDEVLLIMLSKAAKDRFQDAESVISALRDAVA